MEALLHAAADALPGEEIKPPDLDNTEDTADTDRSRHKLPACLSSTEPTSTTQLCTVHSVHSVMTDCTSVQWDSINSK